MRTVVVTGAQGFVGRYVVSCLRAEPVRVYGIGRSPSLTGFTHPLNVAAAKSAPLPYDLRSRPDSLYSYQALDLTDSNATADVMEALRPDIVIHLAGALRDESWSDLLAANLTATSALIGALGQLKHPPRLVFGSSGSIYGAQTTFPVAEDVLPNPVGLYASSKLISEIAAKALCEQFGIPLTIARLFNLVGPGLQPRHLAGRLAHEIAAIENGNLPGRVTTGALNATRDLIDVRDAARMLVALASRRAPPPLVNIASGVETSIRDVAQKLVDSSRASIILQESDTADAPLGADRQVADTRRARDLGLSSEISLEKSLDDMLAYARHALVED